MLEKIEEKLLSTKLFQIPLINKLYEKFVNKEVILYLVFGVLTTIINIFIFWICSDYIFKNISDINTNIALSNTIAFILAVLFAFVTNKNIVFEAKTESKKELFYQISSFFLARIFTFIIDTFGILLFVNILFINKILSKIIFNIVVIVLNYLLSKLLVFKKK